MKTLSHTVIALLAAALAGAQSLPPSPTASVGCEPHEDHWHCDGPASVTSEVSVTSASVLTTTAAPATTSGDVEESESLAPSPTESVGCEPHGDHWHCDGPAETTATGTDVPAESTSESLAPSPTESVGCEPHGDHWHCDGPAETTSGSTEEASATPTGGAGASFLNRAALAGGVLAAMGAAL